MKLVALVGKPNVGKSTLFNRLARRRIAIVGAQPGVTRDRNITTVDYKGYHFLLMDTGGFEPEVMDGIPQKMREQSQVAVEEADLIIFMLDRTSGWTSQDQGVYEFLRNSGKEVYFAVNKVDGDKHEADTAEFFESGVAQIFAISAEHGRGVMDLLERMAEDHPDLLKDESLDKEEPLSIALVGRPNVGKSSLTNCLLGQTKQIVHDEPGTTRDPIDCYLNYHGQTIRLIDTAGIKKKSKVSQQVDKYSMVAALKSVERADVVLQLIDATQGVVEQDARIASHVLERDKALILVINKWDLVEKDSKTMKKMEQEIRDQLEFVSYAPLHFISALKGQRVPKLLEEAGKVYEEYCKRIQTSDLNRILESIVARHAPPLERGRPTKVYYGTQVSTKPPTFVLTTNNPKAINQSYQRFMVNQFRHFFGFEGTPIKVFWRDKHKKSEEN